MPSQPCAPFSLPCLLPLLFEILLIELKCFYNIILSLAVRIVLWNIRFQSVKGKLEFRLLIRLFLSHNISDLIVAYFTCFKCFSDTDCLVVRGKRFGFVDTVNKEYSRDIEMMKGGYADNYYLQMMRNIRTLKGNSGTLSTGPHLHFELWYKGHPVNPEKYIVF